MELRKYPQADLGLYRPLFFSIGLTVSMALVTIVFNWKTYEEGPTVLLNAADQAYEEIMEIPVTQQPPPPPPKVVSTEIISIPDEVEIEEELDIVLDIEIHENTRIQEYNYDIPLEEPVAEEAEEIFLVVEEKPEPVGGYAAFYQYVAENLKYPKNARFNEVSGKVFIQFVIDKNGAITDLVLLKGIGYGCDEEAIRVLGSAPNWFPGKQRGTPVKVRMVLPITFKID